MADTVVTYDHYASGALLALYLYPAAGGPKANAAVNLTQPDEIDQPYRYTLIVSENLSGVFRTVVLPQAGGTPVYLGEIALANDAGPYRVLPQVVDPVTVAGFTAGAKASLGPVTVSPSIPTWQANVACFSDPIVQGDDYSGGRILRIPISNWPGRDLTTAETITLTGKLLGLPSAMEDETISWTGAAVAVDDVVELRFQPTAAETERAAGVYLFDVQAEFGSGEKETPVRPGARLTIVEDYTP